MSDRVRVAAHDPVTGETGTDELDPNGYIPLCGENMGVSSLVRYANGTVQFVIKRRGSLPTRAITWPR